MARGHDPAPIHYAVLQVEGTMAGIDAEVAQIDRDVVNLEAELTAARERRMQLLELRDGFRLMLERAA
jgi:hypothetical protein